LTKIGDVSGITTGLKYQCSEQSVTEKEICSILSGAKACVIEHLMRTMRYIDKLKHELADPLYDIMKCDLNSPQERILSDDKVQLYKKKMAYIFKNVIDSGMEGKDIVNRFAKTILPLFLSELNK